MPEKTPILMLEVPPLEELDDAQLEELAAAIGDAIAEAAGGEEQTTVSKDHPAQKR